MELSGGIFLTGGGYSMSEEIAYTWTSSRIYQHYFRKDPKLNWKKKTGFINWKREATSKLKANRNYYVDLEPPHISPSHPHFFLKVTGSKFWDSLSFQISRKPNNCVFGDNIIPLSPWGRGCKLQTFTIIYIQLWLLWSVQTFSKGLFRLGCRWVGGGGYTVGSFHEGIYHEGGEFPWTGRKIF